MVTPFGKLPGHLSEGIAASVAARINRYARSQENRHVIHWPNRVVGVYSMEPLDKSDDPTEEAAPLRSNMLHIANAFNAMAGFRGRILADRAFIISNSERGNQWEQSLGV